MRFSFIVVNNLMKIFIILLTLFISIIFLIIGIFYIDTTAVGTGILKCKDWIDVKPEVDGIIKEINVIEGQQIKQGDILLVLEDRERKIEVQKAEHNIAKLNYEVTKINNRLQLSENTINGAIREAHASLSTAEAKYKIASAGAKPEEISLAEARIQKAKRNLDKARNDYPRLAKAYSLKIISQMQLEDAMHKVRLAESDLRVSEDELKLVKNKYDQNEVSAAKGDVERCRAVLEKEMAKLKELDILKASRDDAYNLIKMENEKLQVLKEHLALTRISSPISGYILTHDTEHMVGQSVSHGQTVMRVGDCGEFVVDCLISERDFPLVNEGQPAKVQVAPFPKGEYKLFEAKVIKVGSDIYNADPTTIGMDKGIDQDEVEGYYPVILLLMKPYHFFIYGDEYKFKPGFSAEVEIILEKERIISYLFRKVLRITGKFSKDRIHL